ncbi:MAG TPA: aldehyde dehydrogenase family protein [Hyphomicrobiaceae bacterium]|nr:aldehyde dehydrogenase family protein [Hyphomicrobiaceae bacterium]
MSRQNALKFYIDGVWVDPVTPKSVDVINPATEQPVGKVAMGSAADVDKAVAAARRAFTTFSRTTKEERMALLAKIAEIYKRRFNEMGAAISEEMGAPLSFATRFQAGAGMGHFRTAHDLLKEFHFHERLGTTEVIREPIGAVGMITPWNWPANQIACKVAGALAAGCTMVLKPSELAPTSALLLAEMMHEAGVPKGVFNLVNGDGPSVGAAIAAHPGLDMVSFTGSTRAGVEVAIRAAPTVKRVGQELGGKSANILLEDADWSKAVTQGVEACFRNAGQSCNAPTRMMVPAARMSDVAAIAKAAAEKLKVGDPKATDTQIGPVVSAAQWGKIQDLIKKGIDEGATLVTGGPGRPADLNTGYYVRPTVFANVKPEMTVAREEIFGPVLSIMGYKDEADAIRMANEHIYGLAAYVSGANADRVKDVAKQLRAGMVHLNMAAADSKAPFGGYRQSGNGREWGRFGIEEFLEVKAVMGWNAA